MTSFIPRAAVALVASAALALSIASPVAAIAASPKPKSYANCTALNKVYPHGVGGVRVIKGKKVAPKDHVSGHSKPVTNFTRNTLVYQYNDGQTKKYRGEHDLDRDNDGVACEKK